MTLKAAVIVFGSMGRNHARIYWELPNVNLVGVADTNKTTVETIAKRFNAKAYVDYRHLLDEEQPDAVTIGGPTKHH